MTPTPQPLSCQPQPAMPQPLQSSILIGVAPVVPILNSAEPLALTLPSNCANTESFPQ